MSCHDLGPRMRNVESRHGRVRDRYYPAQERTQVSACPNFSRRPGIRAAHSLQPPPEPYLPFLDSSLDLTRAPRRSTKHKSQYDHQRKTKQVSQGKKGSYGNVNISRHHAVMRSSTGSPDNPIWLHVRMRRRQGSSRTSGAAQYQYTSFQEGGKKRGQACRTSWSTRV
ncbi:hypothetical protein FA95DRAFT_1187772 [Auriscalpium vulgare]|uniref:Uncharacterized protein n=1 Tax=Auriscalpium vulgare TaxID=40419 RepID=A0ACB8R533_9AGAM|nr:hypothetical protein FA95DRAFT_1187772 [Auriscalpium vulgare]